MTTELGRGLLLVIGLSASCRPKDAIHKDGPPAVDSGGTAFESVAAFALESRHGDDCNCLAATQGHVLLGGYKGAWLLTRGSQKWAIETHIPGVSIVRVSVAGEYAAVTDSLMRTRVRHPEANEIAIAGAFAGLTSSGAIVGGCEPLGGAAWQCTAGLVTTAGTKTVLDETCRYGCLLSVFDSGVAAKSSGDGGIGIIARELPSMRSHFLPSWGVDATVMAMDSAVAIVSETAAGDPAIRLVSLKGKPARSLVSGAFVARASTKLVALKRIGSTGDNCLETFAIAASAWGRLCFSKPVARFDVAGNELALDFGDRLMIGPPAKFSEFRAISEPSLNPNVTP